MTRPIRIAAILLGLLAAAAGCSRQPKEYPVSGESDLKVTVKPGGGNHFKFEFPRK